MEKNAELAGLKKSQMKKLRKELVKKNPNPYGLVSPIPSPIYNYAFQKD